VKFLFSAKSIAARRYEKYGRSETREKKNHVRRITFSTRAGSSARIDAKRFGSEKVVFRFKLGTRHGRKKDHANPASAWADR